MSIFLFFFLPATHLPTFTNTVPAFRLLQETVGYRVFVLDVSGSMDEIAFDVSDIFQFHYKLLL
jgi:hypothetical protein